MRRLIIAAVLLFILGRKTWADPVDGLQFQSESVATTEFVTAGVINPAGLSFYSANGIRYSHSFTDSTYGGDDALLISSRRGFFGIEWLKHTTNIFRRKFTLALGDRVAKNFYMGFSYNWFTGSNVFYKNMKSWNLGFLYRPYKYVSFGFVADRLNEPKFGSDRVKRRYTPGVAIRPFGNKISLSADGQWTEGKKFNEVSGSFRLSAGPYKGIRFSSDYRVDGTWRIGMTFDFEQMRIGGQGRLNKSQNYDGGSYFVEFSEVRSGSVLGGMSARVGTVTLDNGIVEEPEGKTLFTSPKTSFLQVISALHKGSSDNRISGLLVKIDGARMSFASAQEIREAITEYRKNGKKVTVYIENGGNLAYYIASGADRIIMNPSGFLMLDGLAATATFYKGTMDKLGVKAQVVRTGPYKTYGDSFTESGLTPEAEEQINWLLDDLYDQIVEGISAGRKILSDDVRKIIDSGPYTARDALEAGLVDELKYYDEVKKNEGAGYSSSYADLVRFYEKKDYVQRWGEPKKIAVVYADGSIVGGTSGDGVLQGKLVGGKTLAKSLSTVRSDDRIKAVVLRVNSPGGDLYGSDLIYRQLELLKGKKPLVVSMGGIAASGGYYISCPGDEIMAQPGTITGSIGVVMGKPDLSGLYEKIGLKKTTLKRGDHSDIMSIDRPATPDEIKLAEKAVWQYYGDFVSKVSSWRKLDYDSVDALGQGRVWTGRQALRRGLVDSYGGIWQAIDQARQKAGIDPEDQLEIESYPRSKFSLFHFPGWPSVESRMRDLLDETSSAGLQLRMPFDLDIQ